MAAMKIPPAMERLTPMIRLAQRAMAQAHCPYSKFSVGACLRTASGQLFAGCNVENASFPEGWCAETSAIAAMVLAGETAIEEVVVMTASSEPCAPCGGCRQRLAEFASPETRVHLCNPGGLRCTVTLGELLPQAFRGSLLESFLSAPG